MGTVPQLDPGQARDLLSREPGTVLLDVRENWEYQQVHVEGCCHIPMDELPERLAELNPEQALIVLCHHGNRSRQVANWLQSHGYRVSNVVGGIDAWSEMDPGLPRY
ncbi:MAG TPA: rhodanese-like domain-containing protein [Gammaproteobacteria bacterium]|nr:rhodanese-like domain-containing protein [Gammaproteobacteria bacterium]